MNKLLYELCFYFGFYCLFLASKLNGTPIPIEGEDNENITNNFPLPKETPEYTSASYQEPLNIDDNTRAKLLKFCRSDDSEEHPFRMDGRGTYWRLPIITYRFTTYTPDMSVCKQRNEIKRAFRVWEQHIDMQFEEVTTPDHQVDMQIGFYYGKHMDNKSFDGPRRVLAHAFNTGDMHFDGAELWSFDDRGRVYAKTYQGNSEGASCKFPFRYKGKLHHHCLPYDQLNGATFCSTTFNFDKDGLFGLCESEAVLTYGGSGGGKPCHFPFRYRNQTHHKCLPRDKKNTFCSTTADYDADQLWGYCPRKVNETFGGNARAGEERCAPSYVYEGRLRAGCVHSRIPYTEHAVWWCSTTDNFDRDLRWRECRKPHNLFEIAVHEIGHTMGFTHNRNCFSVMYPLYKALNDAPLHKVDLDGLRYAYGTRVQPLPPLHLDTCPEDLPVDNRDLHLEPSKHICRLFDIDALMFIYPEAFVFKGTHVWRWNSLTNEEQGPFTISMLWNGGPSTVDAVYAHSPSQSVYLFKGSSFWKFNGFTLEPNYPKALSFLGLPEETLRIDAAVNWNRYGNKWTTLFAGHKFYSYNEIRRKLVVGNPRSVLLWNKAATNVSSAMQDPSHADYLLYKQGLRTSRINYHNYTEETTTLWKTFGC